MPGTTAQPQHAFYHDVLDLQKGRLPQCLSRLQTVRFRPVLCELEGRLIEALTRAGFVQVVTPIILSRQMLAKMSIPCDHPLSKQVFWLEKNLEGFGFLRFF